MHIPNDPPAPPVEFFTTTVRNVLDWPVAETLTEAGTLYPVGVENISLKGVGGRPPLSVKCFELSQESPICKLSYHLPENPFIFYLNVVGIPQSPKIPIMEKIYLFNYDESYEEDKEKW